jgi:hypothetical protein
VFSIVTLAAGTVWPPESVMMPLSVAVVYWEKSKFGMTEIRKSKDSNEILKKGILTPDKSVVRVWYQCARSGSALPRARQDRERRWAAEESRLSVHHVASGGLKPSFNKS